MLHCTTFGGFALKFPRFLTNIYREPAELFAGGSVFLSREGTTQGDPLAMALYGLAVIPLIKKLATEAKQVWYADDATGGGKLQQLRRWWGQAE